MRIVSLVSSRARLASSVAALGLLVAACSDSATVIGQEPGLDAPAAGTEPLFVVGTTVVSGELSSSYLTTVASLDAGSFDLSRAVELDGAGTFFARPGSPYVYTAPYEEPTIVRWQAQADGSLQRVDTLSLLNLGLGSAWTASAAPVYSAQKSYFLSEDTGEVVIWDPSSMRLIGTIPLELEPQGALLPAPHRQLVAQGDRLYVTVHWQDPSDWTRFGAATRVIAIDTRSDSVIETSDDARCNYLARASGAADGTLYFSADSFYVPLRAFLGAEHGADSCALRIVPPGAGFDAGYEVSLSSLTGGRPAGDFLLVGEDRAILRAWHPELVTAATTDNWDDVRAEAGYLWWQWDLGAGTAEPIREQEPAASDTLVLQVDGRTLLTRFAADGSSTTLLEVSASGALQPALSGPGYVDGLARVR